MAQSLNNTLNNGSSGFIPFPARVPSFGLMNNFAVPGGNKTSSPALSYSNFGTTTTNPSTGLSSVNTSNKINTTPPIPNFGIPVANAQTSGGNQTVGNQSNSLAVGQNQSQNTQSNFVPQVGENYNPQPPQPVFPGLIDRLGSMAGTSTPEYQAAQKQYDDANQKYQELLQSSVNNQVVGAGTNASEYAGTQGLINNRIANQENAYTNAMNAALAKMGAATSQQQTQQSGLGVAGGLTQPQLAGPTNVPFNPAEGNFGSPAANAFGQNGLTGVGMLQGQIGAGQQYVQNQAIIGKVQPMVKNLDSLISQEGINPHDVTFLNQLDQWSRGTLSSSAIPKFQGQLNDIVASLAQILGVPSSATSDFRTQMAGSIVNGLQNGQSISDSVNYFLQQAQEASKGYLQGAQGANQGGGQPMFGSFFGQ